LDLVDHGCFNSARKRCSADHRRFLDRQLVIEDELDHLALPPGEPAQRANECRRLFRVDDASFRRLMVFGDGADVVKNEIAARAASGCAAGRRRFSESPPTAMSSASSASSASRLHNPSAYAKLAE
jgi:hypothetical protein